MKIKSMRFLFIAVFIFFTFCNVKAQNTSFPKDPKPGKCYERCFYYDKPIEWKAVDCNNIKDSQTKAVHVFHVRKTKEEKIKFIKYQEQLIDFGYKLKANGFLDVSTIKAHHKYLKFKKKQQRKAKRKNRNTL